jgi:sugar (pentulose or hexulose) kinase
MGKKHEKEIFDKVTHVLLPKDYIRYKLTGVYANGKWHQMGVMLSAASCLKWWIEDINKDVEGDAFEKL